MAKNKDRFGRDRAHFQTMNDKPSETVQSDAHLADINQIMRRFANQGMDVLDAAEMQFGDVSDFGDYQQVMQEARRAEETFLALPSKVREVFNHDVGTWLDTAHDADKRQKLVEKGFLVDPEAVKAAEEAAAAAKAAGGKEEGGGSEATPE